MIKQCITSPNIFTIYLIKYLYKTHVGCRKNGFTHWNMGRLELILWIFVRFLLFRKYQNLFHCMKLLHSKNFSVAGYHTATHLFTLASHSKFGTLSVATVWFQRSYSLNVSVNLWLRFSPHHRQLYSRNFSAVLVPSTHHFPTIGVEWRALHNKSATLHTYFRLEYNSVNNYYFFKMGARGSVVVKALCYKPEGRAINTRWGEFLNVPNPSGRTRPWSLLSL
jgi:hypothetical protein